ncbi:MAG: hypothetical protein ABW189_05960 [Rickettsiales bacterium]
MQFVGTCIFLTAMLAYAGASLADEPVATAVPALSPNGYASELNGLVDEEMRKWASDPLVVGTLSAHSKATDYMSASEMRALDATWRSELKKNNNALAAQTLNNPLADYLRDVMRKGAGMYTEIIAADAQGVAVAMTSPNAVYWQGKEECWSQTAGKKSPSPYIGPVRFSDDTGLFQADVAFAVFEGENLVGMIRAGVDVERFDRRF